MSPILFMKLLLFLTSGGLAYERLIKEELAKQAPLNRLIAVAGLLISCCFGLDIAYHFITHDPDRIGFPRFVARKLGIEEALSGVLSCPESFGPKDHVSEECKVEQMEALDRILYKRAKAANAIQGFRNYLKNCKICSEEQNALASIRILEVEQKRQEDKDLFNQAVAASNSTALKNYLKNCITCEQLEQVKAHLNAYTVAQFAFTSPPNESHPSKLRLADGFLIGRDFAVEIDSGLVWRRCALGQKMIGEHCVGEGLVLDIKLAAEVASNLKESNSLGWGPATGHDLIRILKKTTEEKGRNQPFVSSAVFPDLAKDNYDNRDYQGRIDQDSCVIVSYDSGKTRLGGCALRWAVLVVSRIK